MNRKTDVELYNNMYELAMGEKGTKSYFWNRFYRISRERSIFRDRVLRKF